MPVYTSKALLQACDKGQKWLAAEKEKMTDHLDKLRTTTGYNRMQPTLISRGIATMLNPAVPIDTEQRQFQPFGRRIHNRRDSNIDSSTVCMRSIPNNLAEDNAIELKHKKQDKRTENDNEFDENGNEQNPEETAPKKLFSSDLNNSLILTPKLSPPISKHDLKKTQIYINKSPTNTSSGVSKPVRVSSVFMNYDGNGLNNTPRIYYSSEITATRL